jgi:Domain of unknown function (DUF4398)
MHHLRLVGPGSVTRLVVLISGLAVLTACASAPPPPTESLVAARSAIGNAEKADAGRNAAPEISEAREKLTAANTAVEQKDMPSAQRLAEEARVEADLASAKSDEVKARSVNDQLQHDNDALTDELQRKSGSQP